MYFLKNKTQTQSLGFVGAESRPEASGSRRTPDLPDVKIGTL